MLDWGAVPPIGSDCVPPSVRLRLARLTGIPLLRAENELMLECDGENLGSWSRLKAELSEAGGDPSGWAALGWLAEHAGGWLGAM